MNLKDAVGGFFAACGNCGAQGKQMATISDAVSAWNRRAGDVPKRRTVNVGEVAVFPNAKADKEQAKKVLEEAAEVFGAWQCHDMHPDVGIEKPHLLAEIADLVTAACNLAAGLGIDDMTGHMRMCESRNKERGRYDR